MCSLYIEEQPNCALEERERDCYRHGKMLSDPCLRLTVFFIAIKRFTALNPLMFRIKQSRFNALNLLITGSREGLNKTRGNIAKFQELILKTNKMPYFNNYTAKSPVKSTLLGVHMVPL